LLPSSLTNFEEVFVDLSIIDGGQILRHENGPRNAEMLEKMPENA